VGLRVGPRSAAGITLSPTLYPTRKRHTYLVTLNRLPARQLRRFSGRDQPAPDDPFRTTPARSVFRRGGSYSRPHAGSTGRIISLRDDTARRKVKNRSSGWFKRKKVSVGRSVGVSVGLRVGLKGAAGITLSPTLYPTRKRHTYWVTLNRLPARQLRRFAGRDKPAPYDSDTIHPVCPRHNLFFVGAGLIPARRPGQKSIKWLVYV